jgi:hypothetical protein
MRFVPSARCLDHAMSGIHRHCQSSAAHSRSSRPRSPTSFPPALAARSLPAIAQAPLLTAAAPNTPGIPRPLHASAFRLPTPSPTHRATAAPPRAAPTSSPRASACRPPPSPLPRSCSLLSALRAPETLPLQSLPAPLKRARARDRSRRRCHRRPAGAPVLRARDREHRGERAGEVAMARRGADVGGRANRSVMVAMAPLRKMELGLRACCARRQCARGGRGRTRRRRRCRWERSPRPRLRARRPRQSSEPRRTGVRGAGAAVDRWAWRCTAGERVSKGVVDRLPFPVSTPYARPLIYPGTRPVQIAANVRPFP